MTRTRTSGPRLTLEEQTVIVGLHKLGKNPNQIAKQLARNHITISRFLKSLRSTATLARMKFDSEALPMVERTIKDANVDQALEIFDRTGLLEKRRDPHIGGGGPSVVVCVGMPGQPALPPPNETWISTLVKRQAIAEGLPDQEKGTRP